MNLTVKNTSLSGVKVLTTDRFEDYRGEYGGIFDQELFLSNGLTSNFTADQVSMSYKGVLRGLHCDGETTKLVQVLYGSVYNVVVNCDEESPDFGKWESFILSDKNRQQLLIPPKYSNGFYVLTDSSIYTYKLSKSFSDKQFSFAWNDPRFNIQWPTKFPILSKRDEEASRK